MNSKTNRIEWDISQKILKTNPLIYWNSEELWQYIRDRKIPVNELHSKGYPSIGCMPCTRAIQPGEDVRAGRWWWELPQNKECGLHDNNKNLQE
jgi:phosphoadenosine phosphosulfate reductase